MSKFLLLNYKCVIFPNQAVILLDLSVIVIVLDLSNYAIKKQLDQATSVDIFQIAAKNDFIALKAEVDKLYLNKLVSII